MHVTDFIEREGYKNYPWVFHTVLPSISIVNTDWHVIDFFTNVSEFVFQKNVILNVN